VAHGSASVLDAASPVRSASPIVALITRPQDQPPYGAVPPLAVLACDIQDPGNLGAIVRVSEAAGATGVVAAGQCADPFGWKALRGSMGSALRLPLARVPSVHDAVEDALRHHVRLVATVPRGGTPLFDADLSGPLAVLVGGEGLGLADEIVAAASVRVTIPMETPVESLNASVAAALLLYEVRRQRGVRGGQPPSTSD
jgi:TrmH family RNA methyltransferase